MTKYIFSTMTRRCGSITFIQVGANDGQRADPIQAFVQSGKWKGVMIEPVPFVFDKLRENYQTQEFGIVFENCAVGRADGSAVFYACREPHSPLSSFDKQNILKHSDWALSVGLPDPKDYIEEIVVPVFTLETICNRNEVRHIDILLTDTEGYDCKAIQSLNLDRIRPSVIYFEHVHCQDDDTMALRKELYTKKYQLIYDAYNCCAVLPEAIGDLPLINTFQEILIDASNLRTLVSAKT
jgi:FkbM family methyltransferase